MQHPVSGLPNGQNNVETVHGSGSVAHQIIGEFLVSLEGKEEFKAIARDLKSVIFDKKPTEAALRDAMFGEGEL